MEQNEQKELLTSVKIKLLSVDAVMPKKATSGAVAYDVYVPKDTIVKKGRNVVPLDFAIELPSAQYEAKIEPRSGFSAKGMEGYELTRKETTTTKLSSMGIQIEEHQSLSFFACLDSDRFDAQVVIGKVDSDFRDGVGVIVVNRDHRDFLVKKGTRIAQMTIYKTPAVDFCMVEELTPTDRKGGFGSTGTNDIN